MLGVAIADARVRNFASEDSDSVAKRPPAEQRAFGLNTELGRRALGVPREGPRLWSALDRFRWYPTDERELTVIVRHGDVTVSFDADRLDRARVEPESRIDLCDGLTARSTEKARRYE